MYEFIPQELKNKPNWVCYKNKIPIDSIALQPAASNDSDTWGTYLKAIKTVAEMNYEGIGFMFEPPFVGIDLDDCVENGKINQFAQNIINSIQSYTEYSPSGNGVHIICKGHLPVS